MDPSKQHWPDDFKKANFKNSQHGINSSGGDGEDRIAKPKVRWYATQEQLQILETTFNSGMTNPKSKEIKKIVAQLQEFGPVGESNVFYWFQNRKSRNKDKHKQRQPYNRTNRKTTKKSATSSINSLMIQTQNIIEPPHSSSSSSYDHQNVSPNELLAPNNVSSNDTLSLNQNNQVGAYSQTQTPTQTDLQLPTTPFISDELLNMVQPAMPQEVVGMPDLLNHEDFMSYLNGIQMNDQYDQWNNLDQGASMNMVQQEEDPQLSFRVTSNLSNHDSTDLAPLPPITIDEPFVDPFPITQFQGVGEADGGAAKCTVSINNQVFDIDVGRFNVREIFGDGVVLLDVFFQPVPIDEWGVTLEPLQNGASYFLV